MNYFTKDNLVFKILLSFVLFSIVSSSNAMNIDLSEKKINDCQYNGYIDISVEEAWELLSNTTNGIQYPIDVRTFDEWKYERIDTPYPEYARFFTLSELQTLNGINNFKSTYSNKEVIIYCKSGGRSTSASQYLVSNDFNGTIYNMIGGITSWKQAELPIKISNQIPNQPEIILNSSDCYLNITCIFSAISNDPDDDVVRYAWDWNNDDVIDEWTDYFKSNEISRISHKWIDIDVYDIKVLAEDIVGEKSVFSLISSINVKNLPPYNPVISGANVGKNGKSYSYNISSKDPNGDKIYYWIEWHDNFTDSYWEGPYLSDEAIIRNYSWINEGNYTIKVKSKDVHGNESEWTYFKVTMPNSKSKIINNYFIDLKINFYQKIKFIIGLIR